MGRHKTLHNGRAGSGSGSGRRSRHHHPRLELVLDHDPDRDLNHDLKPADLDLDPWSLASRSRSRRVKVTTRLLMVLVLVVSCVVLTASVTLLVQCRDKVRPLEDVVRGSQTLCAPLPFPAYFACVTLAVTIFGLGCVGRRVSGWLLVAVSAVAVLVAMVVLLTHDCHRYYYHHHHDNEHDNDIDIDHHGVGEVRDALLARLTECRFIHVGSPVSSSNGFSYNVSGKDSDNTGTVSDNTGNVSYNTKNVSDITGKVSDNTGKDSVVSGGASYVSGSVDERPQRDPQQQSPSLTLSIPLHCQSNFAPSLSSLCPPLSLMDSSTAASHNQSDGGESMTMMVMVMPTMNDTGVVRCAGRVWRSMRDVCEDGRRALVPLLLSLPLLCCVVGLTLVLIHHLRGVEGEEEGEEDATGDAPNSSASTATRTATVATNTHHHHHHRRHYHHHRHALCGARHHCHRVLSTCLTSLCLRHSCCLSCLLSGGHGNSCCRCCCCPSSSPPPSATCTPLHPASHRSELQLKEVRGTVEEMVVVEVEGEEEEEEEVGQEVGERVLAVRTLGVVSAGSADRKEEVRLLEKEEEECV